MATEMEVYEIMYWLFLISGFIYMCVCLGFMSCGTHKVLKEVEMREMKALEAGGTTETQITILSAFDLYVEDELRKSLLEKL